MAGKYGSPSIFLMVDGYDLTANKVQEIRRKHVTIQQQTDGVGDSWDEHCPTGKSKAEVVQGGAFFDTDTNRIHDAMSTNVPSAPTDTVRIMCIGYAGATIGNHFDGIEGVWSLAYEVLGENGLLTRANAEYQVTGRFDGDGKILQELAAKTASWDTNSSSVNNGASSANGGIGYLQVTAYATITSLDVTIEDSANDIAWASLVAFTQVTAIGAERVTVAGTVDQYLSIDGVIAGAGSVTVFCGFHRNE